MDKFDASSRVGRTQESQPGTLPKGQKWVKGQKKDPTAAQPLGLTPLQNIPKKVIGTIRQAGSQAKDKLQEVVGPREIDLTKKENIKVSKLVRKDLKTQKAAARALAFSGSKTDVMERAEALNRYHELNHKLAANKAELQEMRKDLPSSRAAKPFLKVKAELVDLIQHISRLGATGRAGAMSHNPVIAPAIGALDVFDVLNHSLHLGSAVLKKRDLQKLINDCNEKLKDPHLPETQKTQLKEAVQLLEGRKAALRTTFHAQKTAVAATQLAFSTAAAVTVVTQVATAAGATVRVIPVVGAVAGTITLPIGAALCVDGLVAVYRNLSQAGEDRKTLEGQHQGVLAGAKDKVQQLDDVMQKLGPNVDPAVVKEVKACQAWVAKAQTEIANIDRQLQANELKKAQVKQLKEKKKANQEALTNAFPIVVAALEGKQGCDEAYKLAKGKQVLAAGLSRQQTTLAPYLEQKLKTKVIGEYVRGAGEAGALVSTGLAAAGCVTTVAALFSQLHFLHAAGTPLATAGLVLGLSSTGVVYGGGYLVEKVRNWQLGKDRVRTETFNTELTQQLKDEMASWNAIPAEMRPATATYTMFEMMKKHYNPALPKEWTAEQWASSLVNGLQDGPEAKALNNALSAMLYHDNTKGVIGTLTKHAVEGVGKLANKIAKVA